MCQAISQLCALVPPHSHTIYTAALSIQSHYNIMTSLAPNDAVDTSVYKTWCCSRNQFRYCDLNLTKKGKNIAKTLRLALGSRLEVRRSWKRPTLGVSR